MDVSRDVLEEHYDELSGPDPCDMVEHEAALCIAELLDDCLE